MWTRTLERRARAIWSTDRLLSLAIAVVGVYVFWVVWQRGWLSGAMAAASVIPVANSPDVKDAYADTVSRVIHYEDMLVTIGTIALGILAWFGTAVFGTDHKLGPNDELKANNAKASADLKEAEEKRLWLTFAVIVLVSLMTTVTFTHVFRYYAACIGYGIALEMSATGEAGLRAIASTWGMMRGPASSGLLDPDISFVCLGLYSAFLSSSAVLLFGSRLRRPLWLRVLLVVIIMPSALAYILPVTASYLTLARRANPNPLSVSAPAQPGK